MAVIEDGSTTFFEMVLVETVATDGGGVREAFFWPCVWRSTCAASAALRRHDGKMPHCGGAEFLSARPGDVVRRVLAERVASRLVPEAELAV